jgi:3-phenylpropionate/cinnamic acid dioxygenase small subunit
MTVTQTATVGTGLRISLPGVYGEILDFLVDEADLLDRGSDLEWLGRVTDDIAYFMPIRETYYRADGDGFVDDTHYDDDYASLRLRVKRNVEIQSAYDRDPAARVRRLVTNLVVHQGDDPDEYLATSSILVLRNRFDQIDFDMMSAVRNDVIRRTPDGLKLARRTILLDQSLLGRPWTNVFM